MGHYFVIGSEQNGLGFVFLRVQSNTPLKFFTGAGAIVPVS
jgi:hypothetical protein